MSQQTKTAIPVLLKRRDVERMTTLSKAHIYALIRTNQFPSPIKLSAGSSVWLQSDVEQWINDKINASKGGAQ